MLEKLDRLLQCLGPCRSVALSSVAKWEYSIGQLFPSVEDVSSDRLYVQASLVSVSYRGRIRRGGFRFTVYGGIGSVGLLVADDLRCAIRECVGCEVQNYDLAIGSIAFPNRNSDRRLNTHSLSFVIVQ